MVDFLPFFNEGNDPVITLSYYLSFATRGYGVRVIGVSKSSLIYAESLSSSVKRPKHVHVCDIKEKKLTIRHRYQIDLYQVFGLAYCPKSEYIVGNTEDGVLQSFYGSSKSEEKESEDKIRVKSRGLIHGNYFILPVNTLDDQNKNIIQVRVYSLESLKYLRCLCELKYNDLISVFMIQQENKFMVCDPLVGKVMIFKDLQPEITIAYS